ncbi:MAG: pyridoxamine 5'-phosphate oxidase family protein [Gammaproteobacteria bacterium]|nr:pyridoxamine 5'-phosphate oxidase family protein [Gammaproteobacteria bacterium]
MDKAVEKLIREILAQNNILTLATIRPDGWPQATTVGYANDGMKIYVMTFPQAQKVNNIKHDPRVSLTIDHDESDWNKIKGLSMAARAEIVTDAREISHAGELMLAKFPQLKDWPEPDPSEITVLKLMPQVISVLNYERGFGHTDLVEM